MFVLSNTFQYLIIPNQIEQFCVIGCANWKATNVLWALEIKKQCKKHNKKMSDSLFQFCWKNISRPLFSSSPISSLFLIYFEQLKTWWVHQLGLYKTSLYSRGKDTKIKDVKHKILICFKSPIIKHWIPLTPNTPYLTHPFIESRDVFSIGSTRWRT
jgi:hypothetical protein